MAHDPRITPQAAKDISKLPDKVRPAILEAIYVSISSNPRRAGKRLRLELEGLYSARRGEYRIIYLVDDGAGAVIVVSVAHRRSGYRPR